MKLLILLAKGSIQRFSFHLLANKREERPHSTKPHLIFNCKRFAFIKMAASLSTKGVSASRVKFYKGKRCSCRYWQVETFLPKT